MIEIYEEEAYLEPGTPPELDEPYPPTELTWYERDANGWSLHRSSRPPVPVSVPEPAAAKRRPRWLSLLLWPLGILGRAR